MTADRAERADTEAMEAARWLLGVEFILGEVTYREKARIVARALLQQRESIIEECAKVADRNARDASNDVRAVATSLARSIRALAARKE